MKDVIERTRVGDDWYQSLDQVPVNYYGERNRRG